MLNSLSPSINFLHLIVCMEYIGIHGETSSIKGLLRKRWGLKDIRWRSRWDFDFPRFWVTRVIRWVFISHLPLCWECGTYYELVREREVLSIEHFLNWILEIAHFVYFHPSIAIQLQASYICLWELSTSSPLHCSTTEEWSKSLNVGPTWVNECSEQIVNCFYPCILYIP